MQSMENHLYIDLISIRQLHFRNIRLQNDNLKVFQKHNYRFLNILTKRLIKMLRRFD